MSISEKELAVGGSFRDPSGFVFIREDEIYRQVNRSYKDNYEHLMRSGLYDALQRDELLIPHHEIQETAAITDEAYKVIQPERIVFTSYPYEWSFSQLKDAALLTLRIQSIALEFDMSLKDASAYNVQFRRGRPILIDTLSFEKYAQGRPWVAYRQFCQHFLAPLALMSRNDVRLRTLLSVYLDGVPLGLASKLLPLPHVVEFRANIAHTSPGKSAKTLGAQHNLYAPDGAQPQCFPGAGRGLEVLRGAD